MAMARPDFFLVGAPKCGTTALFSYLRQHPEVFLPRRKEPHFFCTDLYSPRYVHTETEYLALFADAGAVRRIGEASVFYLYSQEAARRIAAFSPDARIIAMLRDPVEMIHALHSQLVFSGHEHLEDFAAALDAEADRRAGRQLPPHGEPFATLQYRSVARYAPQLRRYLEAFGRDRVHIVLHDDLKADAASVYAGVCRFLDIADSHRPRFDVVNPNTRVRSRLVRNVLKFSAPLKRVARLLPPAARRRIAHRIVALNTQVEPRAPIAPELARRLRDELAPDVAEVAALIGRDLAAWRVHR
jgi:hypothetical protein